MAVSSFRSPYLAEDTLVVDVGDGRVVERLSGLRPAIGFFWNVSGVPADAGPTSVHFFRDVEGRVIRIDFATGERSVVAGPGAPRGERLRAPLTMSATARNRTCPESRNPPRDAQPRAAWSAGRFVAGFRDERFG